MTEVKCPQCGITSKIMYGVAVICGICRAKFPIKGNETKDRYISYFYAQGEDAQEWIDIFMNGGAELLIKTLASVDLLYPPGDTDGEPLSEALAHELIGEFAITYSNALSYIGVSKKKEIYNGTT